MADLVKLKTGTIAKLEQGISQVPLDKGSVYFAVDTTNHIGRIVYDAPNGNSVDRIVMSTQAEYADRAGGPIATTSSPGFMSAADKVKLEGIASGAQVNTITGVKGDAESSYRTGNVNITKANIGLGNVENKSSATIRSELTSSNVTTALGYTPATQNAATTGANGLMSATDKEKLDGIATNAEVNQNAFSNIKVGSTTVAADTKTDTLELLGSNVTLTPDATNDKVTIGITKANVVAALGYTPPTTNTTYGNATTSVAGLMSTDDKQKLDGIETGAQVNTVTGVKGSAETDYRVGNINITKANIGLGNVENKSSATIRSEITNSNVTTALGYTPATQDTATTSTNGLMSLDDKIKLDGISNGAEVNQNAFAKVKVGSTTVEADAKQDVLELVGSNVTLTPDATNDKVTIGITKTNVTTALGYTPPTTNTTYNNATTSTAGLMSTDDKIKLDGITSGATNTTISATAPIAASASTGAVTITHATSGPSTTADTSKGDTSNQTPTWGGTFKVTSGTVDKFGHTKTFAEHTVKIPDTLATTTAAGLMSAADKIKIDSGVNIAGNTIAVGGNITADTLRTSLGLSNAMHFIGIATVAITDGSTTNPTISGYDFGTNGVNAAPGDVVIDKDSSYEYVWTGIKWERLGPDGSYALSNHTHDAATTSTAGFMSAADKVKLAGIAENAKNTTISATSPIVASASTGEVSLTHANSGVTATTYGVTATTALTPGFGDTFSVPGFTVNATGHVTAAGSHTVKIPTTVATTSVAGLMSAADKVKLEGIASGATANTGTVTKVTAGTGLNTSADQADNATKGSITTTGTLYLTKSGVTAGSYGPSANATPGYNTTFNVPYITVDAYGRVTAASTKTVKIPATDNTDTKQNITLATTLKAYVTGVTTTPTATANALTGVADTGVYLTTTAGEINATQYKVNEAVTFQYNSTTKSLDFIFVE